MMDNYQLYMIQDDDRPMWVIARGWQDALKRWQEWIREEDPPSWEDEDPQPNGIQLIAEKDDLIGGPA